MTQKKPLEVNHDNLMYFVNEKGYRFHVIEYTDETPEVILVKTRDNGNECTIILAFNRTYGVVFKFSEQDVHGRAIGNSGTITDF